MVRHCSKICTADDAQLTLGMLLQFCQPHTIQWKLRHNMSDISHSCQDAVKAATAAACDCCHAAVNGATATATVTPRV